MPKGKDKSGRLSVFKGREARLNRAIFHTLTLKGPQTIYGIYKEARKQRGLRYTRYASVNKRVRLLEQSGYVMKTDVKKTKSGFLSSVYEITAKAYLVIVLNSIDLDDLLMRIDSGTTETLLAEIIKHCGMEDAYALE